MQKELRIEEYINKLSSNSPTPGGGSAAALVAALSSSLTSMVFNLTIGKKVYNDLDMEEKQKVDNALKASNEYNNLLLEFMDKDGEAFISLITAFKLTKDTEEEIRVRSLEISKGYDNALKVPFNLAEESLKFYSNVLIAAVYGSKNVISDAGVASILLYATIESSVLNVRINLSGIEDKVYREKVDNRCSKILEEALKFKNEIGKIVGSKIS